MTPELVIVSPPVAVRATGTEAEAEVEQECYCYSGGAVAETYRTSSHALAKSPRVTSLFEDHQHQNQHEHQHERHRNRNQDRKEAEEEEADHTQNRDQIHVHEPSPKRRLFFNHHNNKQSQSRSRSQSRSQSQSRLQSSSSSSQQKGKCPKQPKKSPSPLRHFPQLRPSLQRLANLSPSRRDCKHEPRSMSASSSSSTTSIERESNDSIGESSSTSHSHSHSQSFQQQQEQEQEAGSQDPDTNMNINSTDNIIKDEPHHQHQHQQSYEADDTRLFQDDNLDIVAVQEWPLVRRQHRYFPHRSPSSVCGLSVETIATKLGRSPVVVSFKNDDEEIAAANTITAPTPIHGRIQTGRKVRSANGAGDEEEEPPRKGGEQHSMQGDANSNANRKNSSVPCKGHSAADSFLSAIQSTLSHMMCIDS